MTDDNGLDRLDPRGFISQDVALIKKKYLPRQGYQPGDDLVDVAYRQGWNDMLRCIELNVIRGRT